MPTEPLKPFSPPTALLQHFNLPSTISIGVLVTWGLYFVFAIWVLYTLVAIYHWLRYSHASWVAFPAIGIHLFLSFALMSYTLSGHVFFITAALP